MDVGRHPNIELLTLCEVVETKGYVGNFEVTLRKYPRYVTEDCTFCGECLQRCNAFTEDDFNMGRSLRKAIYTPFLQAVPRQYVIDEKACIHFTEEGCQKCLEDCKKQAIDFSQTTEEETTSSPEDSIKEPESTAEKEPKSTTDTEPESTETFIHSSAYIKFDGVDGESKSKDHEGWSEIVAFSQPISSPGGGTTTTRRRGDVVFEDIVVVKQIDKISPKIAESISKGKVYAKVEIHLTGPSEGSTCDGTFYSYELTNVLVTSYKVTGSNPLAYALIAPAPDIILPYSGPFIVQAVDAPLEEISLNFEEIKVTYKECDSAGKSKGNIEYSWKVEEGES